MDLRVHQEFFWGFDTLVCFLFLWVPVPHWGLVVFLVMSLFHQVRLVLGVNQRFPFDLDPLVCFPFPMDYYSSIVFRYFLLPLVQKEVLYLGMHQRFNFDLDTLAFPPFLWLLVYH